MELTEKLAQLDGLQKKLYAFTCAESSLYLDSVTVAPKNTAEGRGVALSILAGEHQKLLTAPETKALLDELAAEQDRLDPLHKREVELLRRECEKMTRIPAEEYMAYTELTNRASDVWHKAKENNDFASFCPILQELVDYNRKFAVYYDAEKAPYDALLNEYERGVDRKMLDSFFATLREGLVPLIHKIGEKPQIDDSFLHQEYPAAQQKAFADYLMEVMGLDRSHCGLGETEHPFTINFSRDDVRITTHYHADMVASSLYSVVHEGGHALYELHTGRELARSNLGNGVSMGIHESQSRFYENIIGRSRAFCSVLLPWLKEHFAPRLDHVTEDDFYRMINKSEPSLIRTEADELTYCLHIMVRYELEKRMFDGTLTAHDLPAEWNRLYKEYLGVDVPNDQQGVLQDSHWSNGNIGYFPSYAIGSAYGAQYLLELSKELDVDAVVRSGDLTPINNWLEEKIWKYGCMKDPVALFESVCGKFDPDCYVAYLEKKFTEVYGL